MNMGKPWSVLLGFVLLWLVAATGGCAGTEFGFDQRWKEEIVLHDGRTLIIERSQSRGGRHEIGQRSPVHEQTIRFQLPDTRETLTWTSEYSEELGRTNFNVLALHVLGGMPYLVVEPNLCLSYNKWGRPNPPYVIFKRETGQWRRITMAELPVEFKTINLIVYTGGNDAIAEASYGLGYVPATAIRKLNSELDQPQFKTILREPYQGAAGGCGEMILTGDGGWDGIGWFKSQPSLEACLKYCESKQVQKQNCPCENLWKGK